MAKQSSFFFMDISIFPQPIHSMKYFVMDGWTDRLQLTDWAVYQKMAHKDSWMQATIHWGPVSTRDNRVLKGPLGRSLRSVARTAHLAYSLVGQLKFINMCLRWKHNSREQLRFFSSVETHPLSCLVIPFRCKPSHLHKAVTATSCYSDMDQLFREIFYYSLYP